MARKWVYGSCKVEDCRRKALPDGYCALHHLPAKPKPPDVLTALCAAVAAAYSGDAAKAGVVVACLQYDPPKFYASVARYRRDAFDKEVVCKAGHGADQTYLTAEVAVAQLAQRWLADNKPAPLQEALHALDAALEQA